MYIFKTENVNLAILETGIGGRYDPTNVFHSNCCGITHLELEHTQLLGDTLEQIAWQKAGIIKVSVMKLWGK